jgi:hypothetical protein
MMVMTGYQNVVGESALESAANSQPVSVAIDATSSFQVRIIIPVVLALVWQSWQMTKFTVGILISADDDEAEGGGRMMTMMVTNLSVGSAALRRRCVRRPLRHPAEPRRARHRLRHRWIAGVLPRQERESLVTDGEDAVTSGIIKIVGCAGGRWW